MLVYLWFFHSYYRERLYFIRGKVDNDHFTPFILPFYSGYICESPLYPVYIDFYSGLCCNLQLYTVYMAFLFVVPSRLVRIPRLNASTTMPSSPFRPTWRPSDIMLDVSLGIVAFEFVIRIVRLPRDFARHVIQMRIHLAMVRPWFILSFC